MKSRPGHGIAAAALGAVIMSACATVSDPEGSPGAIAVGELPKVGRVDERFQSYNVEMVEVTGGNFWAPYPDPGEERQEYDTGPHGAEFATDAYLKREPVDLKGNERLRMLTEALGPAYMRVSGSWANSIYFQNNDKPGMEAPEGYQGVLTREQWAGVVDFAEAVDARILTSFATSEGARDADGAWNPEQARQLFDYTQSLGGRIDAVELTNEPNVRQPTYKPEDFARDQAILHRLVGEVSPDTLMVGPGSTGEAGFKLFPDTPPQEASTAHLLSGTPEPEFDVFSYHFYGAVSQRCESLGERGETIREVTTSPEDALSESWLARADQAQSFYKKMRDRFAPGKPIWITETAQTACGGDPWSSTFLDTFRYVDQMGRFARQDVSIVFHNTLAASDYALIDDETWLPQPNYWAALLWRRLMGEVVLDAGPNQSDLHTYAHCLRDQPGGVALVAINLGREEEASVNLSSPAQRYTLTSEELRSESVQLNGNTLNLTDSDQIPKLDGEPVSQGPVTLAPASITFFEIPEADNRACR